MSSHLEHTASIVREGGETVAVGDVDGYVGAMERVLEDGSALGEQGRKAVLDEFQWTDTVDRTTRVLESLSSES